MPGVSFATQTDETGPSSSSSEIFTSATSTSTSTGTSLSSAPSEESMGSSGSPGASSDVRKSFLTSRQTASLVMDRWLEAEKRTAKAEEKYGDSIMGSFLQYKSDVGERRHSDFDDFFSASRSITGRPWSRKSLTSHLPPSRSSKHAFSRARPRSILKSPPRSSLRSGPRPITFDRSYTHVDSDSDSDSDDFEDSRHFLRRVADGYSSFQRRPSRSSASASASSLSRPASFFTDDDDDDDDGPRSFSGHGVRIGNANANGIGKAWTTRGNGISRNGVPSGFTAGTRSHFGRAPNAPFSAFSSAMTRSSNMSDSSHLSRSAHRSLSHFAKLAESVARDTGHSVRSMTIRTDGNVEFLFNASPSPFRVNDRSSSSSSSNANSFNPSSFTGRDSFSLGSGSGSGSIFSYGTRSNTQRNAGVKRQERLEHLYR